MAFGDVIDSVALSSYSSTTLTFGTDVATPTEGNLMVMVFGDRNNGTTTPSGWTNLYTVDPWSGSSSTRTCIYAKVATSSESNITFAVSFGRPALYYLEIEGSFEALTGGPDILEHSGHAESTVAPSTGLAPGTSGTLSQASTFAVAALTYRGDNQNDSPTGGAATDGFTVTDYSGYADAENYTYGIVGAYKVTSATTALNPTITWTEAFSSSLLSVSAMVVLKESGGGGGGLSIPVAMHHRRQQGMS